MRRLGVGLGRTSEILEYVRGAGKMVEEKNQTGSWSQVELVNVIAAAVVGVVVVIVAIAIATMVVAVIATMVVVAIAMMAAVVTATMVVVIAMTMVVVMVAVMTVFAAVAHPPAQTNELMSVLHQLVPGLLQNTLAYLSLFILLHRGTRIHWEGAWIIQCKPTFPLAGWCNKNIRQLVELNITTASALTPPARVSEGWWRNWCWSSHGSSMSRNETGEQK